MPSQNLMGSEYLNLRHDSSPASLLNSISFNFNTPIDTQPTHEPETIIMKLTPHDPFTAPPSLLCALCESPSELWKTYFSTAPFACTSPSKTAHAVSVRNARAPQETGKNWWATSNSNSNGVQPPSGPTANKKRPSFDTDGH